MSNFKVITESEQTIAGTSYYLCKQDNRTFQAECLYIQQLKNNITKETDRLKPEGLGSIWGLAIF